MDHPKLKELRRSIDQLTQSVNELHKFLQAFSHHSVSRSLTDSEIWSDEELIFEYREKQLLIDGCWPVHPAAFYQWAHHFTRWQASKKVLDTRLRSDVGCSLPKFNMKPHSSNGKAFRSSVRLWRIPHEIIPEDVNSLESDDDYLEKDKFGGYTLCD